MVPVLQRVDPYAAVADGMEGFLFSDVREMQAVLDRLVRDPPLCRRVAASASAYVARHRSLDDHASAWVASYRAVQAHFSAAREQGWSACLGRAASIWRDRLTCSGPPVLMCCRLVTCTRRKWLSVRRRWIRCCRGRCGAWSA